MAARKSKDARGELQVSLIPVIESQEEQLSKELDQAQRRGQNRIRRAQEQAEQHIQQGRRGVSELTEQTRQRRLCEMQTQADVMNVLVRADSLHGD